MKLNPIRSCRHQAGVSITELVAVIAIIGILSAIAVPNLSNILNGSKDEIAGNVVATLNSATRKFAHSQKDLRSTPNPDSAGDDMLILRTLQWRESDISAGGELIPRGPFMRNDWNPDTSSSEEDYRAEWTGSSWRLLKPGTPGAGLKIVFDASDLGEPYIHPEDFSPGGSR